VYYYNSIHALPGVPKPNPKAITISQSFLNSQANLQQILHKLQNNEGGISIAKLCTRQAIFEYIFELQKTKGLVDLPYQRLQE